MIKFDQDKISFEFVLLKSITQALGGSISVIDEEKTEGKKEVTKRYTVPLSVARAFIMKHKKVTKYLKPVLTAIVRYEDRIISMERHAMGSMGELVHEGFDGEPVMWEPYSEMNLNKLIYPLLMNSKRDWFFDGRYIFSFDQQDLDKLVNTAPAMTKDNRFRKLQTVAIDFQELSNADKLQPTERSCLAFITDAGEYTISPPIWKDLGSVGGASKNNKNDDAAAPISSFDDTDEFMHVNLNFALSAGKQIGAMFGYEYVEPLQLPRLMVELHTVNLPNIPKQVKATYNIGMQFTHALAWLLGMSRKADTLDTYVMMRSLLKYLTTKGIFRNNVFSSDCIFLDDQNISNVKLQNLDTLMNDEDYTSMSIRAIIDKVKKNKYTSSRDITQVAGLLNEREEA
jgi:hypothetical protein